MVEPLGAEPSGDGPSADGPRATYEIRLRGEIPASLLARYPDLEVRTIATETVLHRELADPADLDLLLEHLESVGMELAELREIPSPSAPGEVSIEDA